MTDLITAFSSIAAAVVLVGGATVALLQYLATNRHTKQDRTLHLDQAIDSLNDIRVRLEMALPRTMTEVTSSDVARAAKSGALPDLEVGLRNFLARLQILSLAVQSGMADEDFAFELLGSTIVWYGTAYRPYVAALREKNEQPLLYGDLLHLAEMWTPRLALEVRAYKQDGAPFFGRNRSAQRRLKRQLRRASATMRTKV